MEHATKGGQVSTSEVESVQIKLRVKPALRAKLEEAAKENGVSLSQEIVHRLQNSLLVDAWEGPLLEMMRDLCRRVDTAMSKETPEQRSRQWEIKMSAAPKDDEREEQNG